MPFFAQPNDTEQSEAVVAPLSRSSQRAESTYICVNGRAGRAERARAGLKHMLARYSAIATCSL